MTPEAAGILSELDMCHGDCAKCTAWDLILNGEFCGKRFECSWVAGLPQSHCAGCFGDGLFLQDRNGMKGMHRPDNSYRGGDIDTDKNRKRKNTKKLK